MSETPTNEKLQKVLARAGYGSRRELEEWIKSGRIKVNNQVATLGDRVSETDRISVDGKPVQQARLKERRSRVLIYHKPIGEVCTRSDPEGRDTIFNHLPRLASGRWITIGRLDLNTSGLLLITTDGDLANRMMHPSHQVEREYAVRVLGEVTADMLKRLKEGVELDDGPAHFDVVAKAGGDGANQWYHVILREGRNREVRRLWESQGVQVSRLMRVRYGAVSLPRGQRPGRWEELPDDAVNALRKSVGLEAKTTRGDKTRGGFSRKQFSGKPSSGKRSTGKKYAGSARKTIKGRRR
ncbi:Ribosomal large subunit pseudouridine synthase B [hydrothermal vent metagenome]|uniref:Ribosomal large subunit pseudouridine synthase B n=1 Tax=hydrothermal vent metagenome TaxID=652676 RepID=A0A3B1A7T7_9ZZZZ